MKKILTWTMIVASSAALLVGAGCSDDDDGAMGAAGTTGSAGSGGGSDGTGTGPGSNLKCTSSGMNAFQTYKLAGFVAVNDKIIAKTAGEVTAAQTAGKEPGFGPSFNPVVADSARAAKLKTNLADFLVFAYGGPNNYKGRTMQEAHLNEKITEAQYTYFVNNIIVPSLTEAGVTMEDVGSCFAPVVLDKDFVASIINQ